MIQFQVDQGEADVIVLLVGDRRVVGRAGGGRDGARPGSGSPRSPRRPDPADRPDLCRSRRWGLPGRLPVDRPPAARTGPGVRRPPVGRPRLRPAARPGVRGRRPRGHRLRWRGVRPVGQACASPATRPPRPSSRPTSGPPAASIAELRSGMVGGSMAPCRIGTASRRLVRGDDADRRDRDRRQPARAAAGGRPWPGRRGGAPGVLLGRRLRLRPRRDRGRVERHGRRRPRRPAAGRRARRDRAAGVALDRTAATARPPRPHPARGDRRRRRPDAGPRGRPGRGGRRRAAAARIFDAGRVALEDRGRRRRGGRWPDPTDARPRPTMVRTRRRPPTASPAARRRRGRSGRCRRPAGPRDLRLAGHIPAGRDWSEADQSLLDVFARLLRAALDDAPVHARALDRVDRLGRLARLQGDFLRGVSHNLQAPLTNIVVVVRGAGHRGTHGRARARGRPRHPRRGRPTGPARRPAVDPVPARGRDPPGRGGAGRTRTDHPARLGLARIGPPIPDRRPDGRDGRRGRPGRPRAGRLDAPRQRPEVRAERRDRGRRSSRTTASSGSPSPSGTRVPGSLPTSGPGSSAGSSGARRARAWRAPGSGSTSPAASSGRWAARSATCPPRTVAPGSGSPSPASAPTCLPDEGPGGPPGPSGCAVAHFRNAARKVSLPRLGRYPEHDPRWAAPAIQPDGGVTPE